MSVLGIVMAVALIAVFLWWGYVNERGPLFSRRYPRKKDE